MNTSKLNEINAADADTGYGARGVPAFLCRFWTKATLWQRQNDKICRFRLFCIYIRINICKYNAIANRQNGKLTLKILFFPFFYYL
jgi:hypothetical protein